MVAIPSARVPDLDRSAAGRPLIEVVETNGHGASADLHDAALRLQVIARLHGEFGEGSGEIPRIVDEVLASFGNARIRSFLPILVWRRTREIVRALRMPLTIRVE